MTGVPYSRRRGLGIWEVVVVARVAGEIIVDRPIEDVFDFVADERNEPRYNLALLSSDKITDGPIGVGTRFRATHKGRRQPVEMMVDVTRYDRPRRMASKTTMSWSEVQGELSFEPVGSSTKMRWDWDVRARGMANLLRPLIGVIGRRSERACWEGLKRYLESHEPAK
jgi:Polyketide cyclase / dehydrase and lipid transport